MSCSNCFIFCTVELNHLAVARDVIACTCRCGLDHQTRKKTESDLNRKNVTCFIYSKNCRAFLHHFYSNVQQCGCKVQVRSVNSRRSGGYNQPFIFL